jgi:hypothetical protein
MALIRENISAAFIWTILFLFVTPSITEEEWFTDLYAGIANTPGTDVSVELFKYPAP